MAAKRKGLGDRAAGQSDLISQTVAAVTTTGDKPGRSTRPQAQAVRLDRETLVELSKLAARLSHSEVSEGRVSQHELILEGIAAVFERYGVPLTPYLVERLARRGKPGDQGDLLSA